MKKIFEEEQHFNTPWFWIFLIFTFIIFIGALHFGRNELSSNQLVFSFFWILGTYSLMIFSIFFISLKTEISIDKVKFKYSPFVYKEYKWSEVKSLQIVSYLRPWGINFWTKYGTIYNIHTDIGLNIKLKNGKQFLIGSQKIDELENVLKEIKIN